MPPPCLGRVLNLRLIKVELNRPGVKLAVDLAAADVSTFDDTDLGLAVLPPVAVLKVMITQLENEDQARVLFELSAAFEVVQTGLR